MSCPQQAGRADPAQAQSPERPRFADPLSEDLLIGGHRLRQAFFATPTRFVGRDAPLSRAGDPDPAVLLVRTGFAFRSCTLGDGRRAILSIIMPGDFCGLDNLVLARSMEDTTAACRVGYHTLPAASVRDLMQDPVIQIALLALLADAHWRAERLAASLGRMDAQTRVCVLLLDVYDRLRRGGFIARPTFNLPLTQEQIADHLGLTLVHVNRTLRRLREQRIVMVDRQVVIILDLDRLREVAQGLPQPADLPEPAAVTAAAEPLQP